MYIEDPAPPPTYFSHSFSRRFSSKAKNPHPSKKPSISKLSISAPIAGTLTRTSSTSSSSLYSSRSSSPTTTTPADLEARATTILDTLYNAHSPSSLSSYIHPSAHFSHEYVDEKLMPSRNAYIRHWEEKLSRLPDLRARVRECVVDEGQGKVWAVSDMVCDRTGLERRQVVDMLTFDAAGVLVEGRGFLRRVNVRGGEE